MSSKSRKASKGKTASASKKDRRLVLAFNRHGPIQVVCFERGKDDPLAGVVCTDEDQDMLCRSFLERFGYASDLVLAELEITLGEEGRLEQFKETYRRLFEKDWDAEKGKDAIGLIQASRVLHELEPKTYSSPDSWVKAAKSRTELSSTRLVERALESGRRVCESARGTCGEMPATRDSKPGSHAD